MKAVFQSTKIIELGSCAFRQWRASHSHCRFLHGYQLKAKLWFSGSSLDDKNWCVDFGGLKELKAELKSIYDHTTTVAADDPELETFKRLHDKGIIQLYIVEKGVGIERAAENVFEIAQKHIKYITNGRCWVDKVEVFEHEENSATYSQQESKAQLQSFKADITSTILDNSLTIGTFETQTITASNLITANRATPYDSIINAPKVDNSPAPGSFTGAAQVGSGPISNSMGNPFAGTSWGA